MLIDWVDQALSIYRSLEVLLNAPPVTLAKVQGHYLDSRQSRSSVNSTPGSRDNVPKANEFALSHVGPDKDSGEIWRDYFLRSGEVL